MIGEMSLVKKMKVVEEMRVVRGKYVARNPEGAVFNVYGIKLNCLVDTVLDREGSRERNSSQVIFLV